MTITIKDIAREANVSITTVSMILNNKGDSFSEETRNKVLRLVEEMGYKPNALARSLVTKKTKTIGLIVPDITNPFYTQTARAIEDVANNKGYSLILCNTDNDFNKEKKYIKVLKEKYIDGIIFTTSAFIHLDKVREIIGDTPIILLDENVEADIIHGVFLDNLEGGYEAAKHLLQLGHRRIACVTGPPNTKNAIDRMNGFKKALKEFEVPFCEDLVYEGNYKLESGIKAVEKFEDKEYSAIFAFNDMMAFGVYKGLKSKGLKVPDDVSVVGFDNLNLSEIVEPCLTTIAQPNYEMGTTAAKMLINIIEDKNLKDNVQIYKPQLIVRGSTKSIEE